MKKIPYTFEERSIQNVKLSKVVYSGMEFHNLKFANKFRPNTKHIEWGWIDEVKDYPTLVNCRYVPDILIYQCWQDSLMFDIKTAEEPFVLYLDIDLIDHNWDGFATQVSYNLYLHDVVDRLTLIPELRYNYFYTQSGVKHIFQESDNIYEYYLGYNRIRWRDNSLLRYSYKRAFMNIYCNGFQELYNSIFIKNSLATRLDHSKSYNTIRTLLGFLIADTFTFLNYSYRKNLCINREDFVPTNGGFLDTSLSFGQRLHDQTGGTDLYLNSSYNSYMNYYILDAKYLLSIDGYLNDFDEVIYEYGDVFGIHMEHDLIRFNFIPLILEFVGTLKNSKLCKPNFTSDLFVILGKYTIMIAGLDYLKDYRSLLPPNAFLDKEKGQVVMAGDSEGEPENLGSYSIDTRLPSFMELNLFGSFHGFCSIYSGGIRFFLYGFAMLLVNNIIINLYIKKIIFLSKFGFLVNLDKNLNIFNIIRLLESRLVSADSSLVNLVRGWFSYTVSVFTQTQSADKSLLERIKIFFASPRAMRIGLNLSIATKLRRFYRYFFWLHLGGKKNYFWSRLGGLLMHGAIIPGMDIIPVLKFPSTLKYILWF